MNLFNDYGLSKLINAVGPSTFVGTSRVSKEVIAYMESVLTEAVDMRQLQELANEVIRKYTGAEAGCVTGCSAAGVAVGVAAFLTGENLAKITSLPKPVQGPNHIVIQKAQMISGGGCSIELLLRLSGAEIIEVGESADCGLFQLDGALDESIAGAVFVNGSRAITPGTIPLKTFTRICHEHKVPVLVDAAAEVNIRQFIDHGADLVVASSHKWLGGPTAGLIAGRADLVHACFLNGEFGIGRPMKVGKEGIAGLIGALETYRMRTGADKKARNKAIVEHLYALLDGEPGLQLQILERPGDSPNTCALRITIDPGLAGLAAWELNERLMKGNPRIALDAYEASEGYVTVNPGLLDIGDEEIIASRIKAVIADARKSGTEPIEYIPRFETLVSYLRDWRKEYPVLKNLQT
jgi:D-glucosaminate-6-phosphate ammonia-lyase